MKLFNMATALLAGFIALSQINAISARPGPILDIGGGERGGGLLGIVADLIGGFGGNEYGIGLGGGLYGGGFPLYAWQYPFGGGLGFGSGLGFPGAGYGLGGGLGYPIGGGLGYGGSGIKSGSYTGSDATNVSGYGNTVKKDVKIN